MELKASLSECGTPGSPVYAGPNIFSILLAENLQKTRKTKNASNAKTVMQESLDCEEGKVAVHEATLSLAHPSNEDFQLFIHFLIFFETHGQFPLIREKVIHPFLRPPLSS